MFATIYLPNFFLQASLRYFTKDSSARTDPAVAIIDEEEAKPVILQLNAVAEAAGVRAGMTPSQALARCLTLVIRARSAPQEKAARDILLEQAFALTPFVEDTAPGLCTLEFTSTRNLPNKLTQTVAAMAACQLAAQIGLGPTPDTSFLAAHLARPICEIDNAKDFLAPLPIEILAL